MSAVPKKKLCWNSEGNVARNIDNCPYCGVYIHSPEIEEDVNWNPHHFSSKTEEIPSPIYQSPQEDQEQKTLEEEKDVADGSSLLLQLKRDIFPILFLMTGSIFFLFGVVLVLFSQNGTFTLQWQESHGFYFLLFAFPLIIFGWKFLQQLETKN